MANSKGSQNVKDLMYPGKNALLPPKIPFPSVSAPYSEYIPTGSIGSRHGQKVNEEKTHHHQRTSSESDLVEEPPFWLDDLLNEPESPVRKCGHRRSSSDSYAYLDVANAKNISLTLQNDFSYRNMGSSSQRGVHELDWNRNAQDAVLYSDSNFLKQTNRQRDSLIASGARPSWLPFSRESVGVKHMGAPYLPQEGTVIPETKNYAKTLPHEAKKFPSEDKNSNPQPVTYDADNTRRAKQQFAQRSRVRKLQYISELERNVQALQAEGSKVSAELDFLNQRNLILSMENKALKQRLESIAQEKLIKQLEQEVLEKEIGRLRALYQQQQQQQQQKQQQQQTHQPSASHKRSSSKDLDSQFSSLSLNTKDSNCRRDSVSVTSQFNF